MDYTRSEILHRCKHSLADIRTFYKQKMINYRGRTSDTNEYYTEVVAEFVCRNIDEFNSNIPMISRKGSYKTGCHVGSIPASNRNEEIIAIKMYNRSQKEGYVFPCVGRIIDYQTPLKSTKTDVAGKIDLLSYDGCVLHILELKKPDSAETMLRCVLEAFTYLKTVDANKLLSDFSLPSDITITANPLVFKDGIQHLEMKEERKWLKQLMYMLKCKPYYVVENNGKYNIDLCV